MRTRIVLPIRRRPVSWLVLVLFAGCAIINGTAQATTPAGIAATVNGTVISIEELNDALRLAKIFSPTDTPAADLRSEAVRNLMRRAAAVQEATRRGYSARLDEVDAHIASLQARFENRGKFQDVLERNGISSAALQRQVAKDILVFKLIQDTVIPQVHITDEDVRYYYESNPQYFLVPEKVRVRHILLRVPEDADSAKKKEIRGLLLHIKDLLGSGADFSSVAAAHSQDISAENGGDIGFFSRDDVAKSFADAAFALAPGEISDVVSTPLGYHLIQQLEKRPESVKPFEDIRLPLTRSLRQDATSLLTKVLLDRLLSASEVTQSVK
ncbi:MAG: peptidylprolyl isomerase [Pseudomonadota bacterium]